MTKTQLNLLVKKHFGEDYKGVILFTNELSTQVCIIDEHISGTLLVFTFTNKDNNVFETNDIDGCFCNSYFCKRWVSFMEELEELCD